MPTNRLTQKQIDFCDNVLAGVDATNAYISAGYSPGGATQSASRLLTTAKVCAYIADMRAKSAVDTVLTIVEMREARARVVRAEDSSNSDILMACRDDSKTMGWDKPEKVEKTGSLIDQIRGGKS